MLEKFLKIYTIVASVLIVIALGFAVYYWVADMPVKAYYLGFVALIFGFILFITRRFIMRNLHHPKK